MGKYEQILQAIQLFGLNEYETINKIKKKINQSIKKWHPDTSKQTGEECNEKSISLIKARELIMDYLGNYKISFKKEEIEKYISPRELWMRQFGHDHIWGNGEKK
jgi:hypothetical protein